MPEVIVLGGGMCGMAAAMMLARDGHEVTVLERDPAPVPATVQEAWEQWERRGVAQFHQAHYFLARGGAVLEEELPDVRDALLDAGALDLNPLAWMPPTVTENRERDGDERFRTITARRPTLEYVMARAAAAEPGLDVRRGVAAAALLTTMPNGTAHVTGVHTTDGDELRADLVVDAMGRVSQLPRLLATAGTDPLHEDAEESGFIYYTRFFSGPTLPAVRAPLVMPLGSISLLTLPADNSTWSVTVFVSAGDQPLKRLRDADRWTAVVSACPLQAHWLEGEPISGIEAMGGQLGRMRRLLVDGRPVATGLALLADACACTNPSQGRGISLGLLHARQLRHVVRAHGSDPHDFVEAWDAATEAEIVPWYHATVRTDRDRLAQIEALRAGLAPPPPADGPAALRAALPATVSRDADMFRALQEWVGCLALPDEILARPAVAQRIAELTAGGMPPPPPGPDREQVLALLA